VKQRIYISQHKSSDRGGRTSTGPWRSARGFTLVEMMVVIAIMVILVSGSNVLFRQTMSKAVEPAGRIARCIEMARATATASNHLVAIRFDPPESGERELVMRFFWMRPGQPDGDEVEEFRRPEKFKDLVISSDVKLPIADAGATPDALTAHNLAADESLVITTDGQVFVGTQGPGFPVPAAQLEAAINLGIQPTIGGRVVDSVKRDIAIVQIQCATGTTQIMQP
jgi:prepilin-type N-terminal cleavage/methylation domain-containing protein